MKTKATYWKWCLFLCLLISFSSQAQRGRHYSYRSNYYPVRGQYFNRLPSSYISLRFGGSPFYYSAGLFYRPYGSYFSVTVPPFGIHVNVLPRGYWPLRMSGYPYFYSNGIFYRQTNSDYEVVQAPVGAEVPSIPRDSKAMVIDGEKYYEYNGTYFKDYIKPNGELWYTVEGKHGVLNTDKNAATHNYQPPAQQEQDTRPSIGEVFDTLPDNYKTIVINNKKYFLSTDHVYYEEVIDGKQVRYKVAGK
jgi:hypothetical protein